MKQPIASSSNSTMLLDAACGRSTGFDDGCRAETTGDQPVWPRSETDDLLGPALGRPAAPRTGRKVTPVANRRATTGS
jgi:hypothetical protein